MPKHVKITEKEKKELLQKYGITQKELPKIKASDAALIKLKAKPGDIIKIIRNSVTAGEAMFYRGVVDG